MTSISSTRPTLKAWLKSLFYRIGNFFIRYPLATAATVFIIIAVVLAATVGHKLQVGGILGKLWGKTHPRDLPDGPVVIPPSTRVDSTGAVIPPGISDDKGFTQVPIVLAIKDPGVMSDPTTVVVTDPSGQKVTLPLPKGVKNADVKEVVLVAPNIYQVANHDKGVDAKKLLKDLTK